MLLLLPVIITLFLPVGLFLLNTTVLLYSARFRMEHSIFGLIFSDIFTWEINYSYIIVRGKGGPKYSF